MDKPKIIFMGTPAFAVPTMIKLHETYNLSAVVTVPDRKKGRGRKLSGSPVKEKAVELGIPVLQPESLKDESFVQELKSLEPDIMCVVAFRILPEIVYSISNIATFNIHGSLLPKYRGAAPINRAIMNGDEQTGLTSFILDKKVDTGNIMLKKEIELPFEWSAGDLHDNMMPLSADLAKDTCELLLNGDYLTIKQDDSEATPAPKIFRDDCLIDFNRANVEVYNHIRGLSPYPAAWMKLYDTEIKVLKCELDNSEGTPSQIIINDNELIINCLKGSIKIIELKPEGKRAMKIEDFLRGWKKPINHI